MKIISGSELISTVVASELVSNVGLKDACLSGWFRNDSRELYEGFKLDPDDILLDIGCGVGKYSQYCSKFVKEIILADIDQNVLLEAQTTILDSGHKSVRALLTNGFTLNLANESVTKVIALEVVEHTKKPQEFVNELARVAKKNALLLISVPHIASESIQKNLAPECYFQEPQHINIFSEEDLAKLVEGAGLAIQHKGTYGFFWTIFFSLFWASGQQFDAGFRFIDEFKPVLEMWTRTWDELLKLEDGLKVKATLDKCLPKSMIVVAKKI